MDELIQSSEQPSQVSAIIVIISIFIYTRKLRQKEVSRLPGVTHPVGGRGGIGPWVGWLHCLSTETDRRAWRKVQAHRPATQTKSPTPAPHVHTAQELRNRAGGKHTGTPLAAPPAETFSGVLIG